jgi:hypothetical protein
VTRPVYSTLFVGDILAAGDPPVGFIPVEGQIAVIRDIELFDFDALPGDEVRLTLEPSGGAFKLWTVTGGGSQMIQWQGRIVVPYGFAFNFTADTGTWRILCSGYVLTNP